MAGRPPVPPDIDPRLARPWRLATMFYGIALTLGTHWPNLRFGAEMPATDKTTHLMAFAGLTILLARSRWFGSPWRAAAVAAVWSIADELTQGIPGLNRAVGFPDIAANLMGCLLSASWLAALGPVGGLPSRWRHAMLRATLDRVFLRPWPWGLAVGLMLVTAGAYVGMRRFDPPLPEVLGADRVPVERGLVLTVAIIAAHVGVLAVMRWWQRSIDRAREAGLCVSCGRSVPDAGGGAAGATAAANAAGSMGVLEPRPCPACGRTAWAAAWLQSSPLRPAAMARAARRPAIVVGLVFLLAASIVFVLPYGMRATVGTSLEPGADAVRQALGAVPSTLETSIDITLTGLLLAAATRWTRRRMAAAFDRPTSCRSCGHDLRGTPRERGIGRCAECGEIFLASAGETG